MSHIMLDIETWGTQPGSVIRSIGAVVFDPASGKIGETFYRNIDDATSEAVGLRKDASTVRWWGEQSQAAKSAFSDPAPVAVTDALRDFTEYWNGACGTYVYGHGATFDPVLMEAAYVACMLDAPWKFWNVRCCRTILALANRKPQRGGGTHHNALDDAIAQAKAVAAAFRTGQFNPN